MDFQDNYYEKTDEELMLEAAELDMERACLALRTLEETEKLNMREAEVRFVMESASPDELSDYYAEATATTKAKKKNILARAWEKIVAFINKVIATLFKRSPKADPNTIVEINQEDVETVSKIERLKTKFANAFNANKKKIAIAVAALLAAIVAIGLWRHHRGGSSAALNNGGGGGNGGPGGSGGSGGKKVKVKLAFAQKLKDRVGGLFSFFKKGSAKKGQEAAAEAAAAGIDAVDNIPGTTSDPSSEQKLASETGKVSQLLKSIAQRITNAITGAISRILKRRPKNGVERAADLLDEPIEELDDDEPGAVVESAYERGYNEALEDIASGMYNNVYAENSTDDDQVYDDYESLFDDIGMF